MTRREGERRSDRFEFTDNERLFNQLTHERFQALLADRRTIVHQAQVTSNLYGEYLFITLSRPSGKARTAFTFYGIGFHEQRERWIVDTWSWYEAHERVPSTTLTKAEVQRLIAERQAEIGPAIGESKQSKRAQFFEMLADLTDEDGALAEIEDLEYLGFDFDEDDDEIR